MKPGDPFLLGSLTADEAKWHVVLLRNRRGVSGFREHQMCGITGLLSPRGFTADRI